MLCRFSAVGAKRDGAMRQAGLGDEPRKVIHEFSQTQLIDVILPTRQGHEIRRT